MDRMNESQTPWPVLQSTLRDADVLCTGNKVTELGATNRHRASKVIKQGS